MVKPGQGVLSVPHEPEMTLEEHAVLGLLVTGRPQSVRELHATFERTFGDLLELNVFELRRILNRLESLGYVETNDM